MEKQHRTIGAAQQDNPLEQLGTAPGTYALLLRSEQPVTVTIGSLGPLHTQSGWYLYVGSAFGPGGVRSRCRRHQRGGRRHWHMDYLRPLCELRAVWYTHDSARREHQWAGLLAGQRNARLPFPGFGSSDCDCRSHLFWFPARPSFDGFSRRLHKRHPDHGQLYRCILFE